MRDVGIAVLIAVAGAATVAATQPGLARELHDSKAKDDVWKLPSPALLRVGTLGHTSAVVDWLWSSLVVDWSIHISERRAFPDVFHYLDAIVALEPDYAPLYQYVDTLLCFRIDGGDASAARSARQYLERGIKERPGDADTWLHYGQFLAYMSPTYIPKGDEQDEWIRTGANAITKAVDLGSDASRALSAASLLVRYGEKDAAIRSLRRAYALTDDPTDRQDIANKLSGLQASLERDAAQDDMRFIETQWRSSYPFIPRDTFLLIGPIVDPAKCAGPSTSFVDGCERSWSAALPSSKTR